MITPTDVNPDGYYQSPRLVGGHVFSISAGEGGIQCPADGGFEEVDGVSMIVRCHGPQQVNAGRVSCGIGHNGPALDSQGRWREGKVLMKTLHRQFSESFTMWPTFGELFSQSPQLYITVGIQLLAT